MPDHAEACRHVLELFSNVFAQELHLAAALRALLARLRQIRLNVARQMFGQWPARCLFRYPERCLRNFNWRRAFVGFELFESQFELLDLPVQSLGLAPELHAAQ